MSMILQAKLSCISKVCTLANRQEYVLHEKIPVETEPMKDGKQDIPIVEFSGLVLLHCVPRSVTACAKSWRYALDVYLLKLAKPVEWALHF